MKISFRAEEGLHPEEFEVFDAITNKRLAREER